MNKDKIKNLASDDKFISGIYNYCDSWCERCPQTSRCLNFTLGEEEFSDPETRDIKNGAFWEKMSEIMQTTFEMLNDMMISAGIDPEEIDDNESVEEGRTIKEVSENHVVCRKAREYADMVDEWIDGSEYLFGFSGNETSIEDEDNIEAESNNDTMDVIRWYQHQIYVKLMRAVSGSIEESNYNDDFASDSDGSAKVALIGIDRSIAAWGNINRIFPGFYADNTKNILIHLEGLRRKVEKTFPNARKFIRPGFDNIDLNS